MAAVKDFQENQKNEVPVPTDGELPTAAAPQFRDDD